MRSVSCKVTISSVLLRLRILLISGRYNLCKKYLCTCFSCGREGTGKIARWDTGIDVKDEFK